MRVALVLVGLLAAVGCSASGPEVSEVEASTEPVPVEVRIWTFDSGIGVRIDDATCEWSDASYVVRDENGSTIASGAAGSRGEIMPAGDLYRCDLPFELELPPVNFYEISVTVRDSSGFEIEADGIIRGGWADRAPVLIQVG